LSKVFLAIAWQFSDLVWATSLRIRHVIIKPLTDVQNRKMWALVTHIASCSSVFEPLGLLRNVGEQNNLGIKRTRTESLTVMLALLAQLMNPKGAGHQGLFSRTWTGSRRNEANFLNYVQSNEMATHAWTQTQDFCGNLGQLWMPGSDNLGCLLRMTRVVWNPRMI
jgi:hypothetical protein